MAIESLDIGLYTNIFPVQFADATVDVMTAKSTDYPDLRRLREEIHAVSCNLRVYRMGDIVIGYGSDLDWLVDKKFEKKPFRLYEHPKWCTRMIMEGLTDRLKSLGYREWLGKGRIRLYEPQPFRQAAQGRLRVFRGYDLRAIYWYRDQQLLFGLIVDICWEIQDTSGTRLSTPAIAQYNATIEIGQIQEELLSNRQINPEVSRLRLQNHILPFVRQNNEFSLPCGEKATVDEIPLRVILGV